MSFFLHRVFLSSAAGIPKTHPLLSFTVRNKSVQLPFRVLIAEEPA